MWLLEKYVTILLLFYRQCFCILSSLGITQTHQLRVGTMQLVLFFVLSINFVKAWQAEKNVKYSYPTAYSYEQLVRFYHMRFT